MAPQIAEKVPCSKITGGAYFLRPSERFKVEKPYAFKFPLEDNSVQQTNMDFDKIKISATNMRGFEKSFSLETNGFAITEFDMALPYEDYHDERLILPYFRQIEDWLKERLGARHVEVFRHGVIFHPFFLQKHSLTPLIRYGSVMLPIQYPLANRTSTISQPQ